MTYIKMFMYSIKSQTFVEFRSKWVLCCSCIVLVWIPELCFTPDDGGATNMSGILINSYLDFTLKD